MDMTAAFSTSPATPAPAPRDAIEVVELLELLKLLNDPLDNELIAQGWDRIATFKAAD